MPASDSRTFGAGSLCVFAKVSLANQGDAIAVGSRGWQSVCAVRPGCLRQQRPVVRAEFVGGWSAAPTAPTSAVWAGRRRRLCPVGVKRS